MGILGEIKVGDVLYNYTSDSYVKVIEILKNVDGYLIVSMKRPGFPYLMDSDGYVYRDTVNGNKVKGRNREIFWGKPTFSEPEKPKKLVKEEINMLCGVFRNGRLQIYDDTWCICGSELSARILCERMNKNHPNLEFPFYVKRCVNIEYVYELEE